VASGDCTIGLGGGVYWLEASIYVGSTLADQTNVPTDGTPPSFSDESVWAILPNGQTPPSGPALSLSTWKSAVLATGRVLALAEGVYSKNGQQHPLPMFLELIDETEVPYVQGMSLARRTRTYLVKDTNGQPWDNVAGTPGPLTVYEKFIKVFGTGGLPDANNPDFGNKGWNLSNKDLTKYGTMDDDIGQQFAQPEVDYLQLFWATGFNATGLVLPSTIVDVGLPGAGPQIPLFIRDHRSKCKQGDFSVQGIELNTQFVGINGDTGIGTSCRN
jgi:hypothetical protein